MTPYCTISELNTQRIKGIITDSLITFMSSVMFFLLELNDLT